MNKRSAVLTAGGLAASFTAGAAAVTLNWGMGMSSASNVAAATGRAEPAKALKPIVRHRTIVIHRQATPPPATTASAPAARTVVVPSTAPTTSTTSKSVTTTGGSITTSGESDHEGSDG